MKIYLSGKPPISTECKNFSTLHEFNSEVLDGEATCIIVDSFLSKYKISELDFVLEKIFSKMRIGCELVLIEKDIDSLCLKYQRDEIDILELNQMVRTQEEEPIGSFLTLELILSKLKDNIQVNEKFTQNDSIFIIKGKRVK